jgi:pyridoxine kinase
MLLQSPVIQTAAMHDLSGFGRTSLSEVIPILSLMGIKVCPLPTAVLSYKYDQNQGILFERILGRLNIRMMVSSY